MERIYKNFDEIIEQLEKDLEVKFKIKVVANSKNNSVEFLEDFIKVKIKQRAVEGKANKAIIEYLSDLLNVAKSKVSIASGEKSSIKTIKVKL